MPKNNTNHTIVIQNLRSTAITSLVTGKTNVCFFLNRRPLIHFFSIDCFAIRVVNQIIQIPKYAVLRSMNGFDIYQVNHICIFFFNFFFTFYGFF